MNTASDGLEAVKALRGTKPGLVVLDLILLDVEMSGMNRLALCKRLRALPGYQKTPVIYVTAHSDFGSRAKSVLRGGNDLIDKPVFPMELGAKAVTHLLKSQLAAQKPVR